VHLRRFVYRITKSFSHRITKAEKKPLVPFECGSIFSFLFRAGRSPGTDAAAKRAGKIRTQAKIAKAAGAVPAVFFPK